MGFMQKPRFSLQRGNERSGWRRRSAFADTRPRSRPDTSPEAAAALARWEITQVLINSEHKFTVGLEAHANHA